MRAGPESPRSGRPESDDSDPSTGAPTADSNRTSHLGTRDRGQSIQVGAVLLFGALIIAFSSYQAFVVPQQNKQVEFNHNLDVQSDMHDLRNAIVSQADGGSTKSVRVKLGTRYPARLLAINPGPAAGSLRTAGTSNSAVQVSILNAKGTDAEIDDFWTGSSRSYGTGAIVYRPNYNVYNSAPTTVYENSILYNRFQTSQQTLTLTDQTLIRDNDISVLALGGSLEASKPGATSIDVVAASASETEVTITDNGSPITLQIATRLDVDTWRTLLDSETTSNGGHITAIREVSSPSPSLPSGYTLVEIELETGVTYELDVAKVGVGTDFSGGSKSYMTAKSGDGETVREGNTIDVTVQVRDQYNNPVSGVKVKGTAAQGTLSSSSVTTDADGTATFTYTAPSVSSSTDVNLDFSYDSVSSGFSESDPEDVRMTVTVQPPATGGGGGAYTINWPSESTLDSKTGVDCSTDPCQIDGSTVTSIDLTSSTSPVADGATVEYAVSDRAIATVSPTSGTLDSQGEHTTTLSIRDSGTVKVYTYSGGDGDVQTFEIVNFSPSGIAEIGKVSDTTATTWQTQSMTGSYENPVVIAKPVSDSGDHVHVSIQNVDPTQDTFQWKIDTFGDDPDSVSSPVSFHYMVVEAGVHQLKDGAIIEAGTTTAGGSYSTVGFDHGFSTAPIVASQPQTQMTTSGGDRVSLVTRQQSVGPGSFDVKLQEREGLSASPSETVGYVAIEQSSGTNSGTAYETGLKGGVDNTNSQVSFTQNYGSAPAVIAQMQTENGGNTAWERYADLGASSVKFSIDEETIGDGDTSHTTEEVGYFVYGSTGSIPGTTSATLADVSNPVADGSNNQRVKFTLKNTGSQKKLRVDAIKLNSTSASATKVEIGGDEMLVDGSGVLDTSQIDIGGSETPLDTIATVPTGGSVTVTLQDFLDSTDSAVAMGGKSLTLTLYFDDGSERTYTLSIEPPLRLDSAEADSGKKTVTLTFSEGVYTSTGGTGDIVASDLTYNDNGGSGSDASAIASVSHTAGDATATVTLDATTVSGDVGADEIAPKSNEIYDADGNAVSTDPATLQDTTKPADPVSTSGSAITTANEGSYSVDVELPDDHEAGTVTVQLEDSNANTVTGTVSVGGETDGDSSTDTVTVSGIDASSLVDGSVTITAKITDFGSNTNPSGFTASSTVTKDTTGPSMNTATTADTDDDGKIDEILIDMDEAIDDSDSTLTTSAFSLSAGSLSGVTTGSTADDDKILLTLDDTGAGAPTTGDTPDVTMETGSGSISIEDADGNSRTTDQTITSTDGAGPIITGGTTADTDSDGQIDQIDLTYNEPIASGTPSAGDYAVNGYTVSGLSSDDGDATLRIELDESGSADTDATPTVTYTQGTTADDAGNLAPDQMITASDDVAPTILSATTADTNNNGEIDQIDLTYSEPVDSGTTTTSDYDVSGYSEEGLVDDDGDDTLGIDVQESGSPDTGATPDVSYTQGTTEDTAGNLAPDQTLTTSDSAAPSISSFTASNPSGKTIDVSFTSSEPLSSATVEITDSNGNVVATLTKTSGLSESCSGDTCSYSGSTTVSSADTYTATLTVAEDSAGNDGSGASDTVTIQSSPTISNVNLDGSSGNMDISFDSDEQLGSSASDVKVVVTGPNGKTYTFDRNDFSESGSGPYTYTLSTTQAYDDGSGTYTAEVKDAKDSDGNNGGTNGQGSGLTDTYSTLSSSAVAYDDQNTNGNYDNGETTYTENDLDNDGGDADVQGTDLVIEKDITVSKLDVDPDTFTAKGVRIETTGGTLKVDTEGAIDVSSSTLKAKNGKTLEIIAGGSTTGDIDIRDAKLISNKNVKAEAQNGGVLKFNKASGGDPGTRIVRPNGLGQTLDLNTGSKDGENGASQPEKGTINV